MTDWTPLIDVSYAQGLIDFPVIKRAGIPGVIIRACNALKRDTRFDRNWPAAKDAGLDVAVYGFSNPKAAAGPNEQGAFLAELAHEASAAWIMHDEEGYTLEAGPNPVLKGAPAAAWTAAKVRRCVADSGMAQVLYTGQPYWDSTFTPGVFDRALGRFTAEWRADLEYLALFDLILARYIAQRSGPPVYDGLPRGVTPDRWAEVVLATGKTAAIPKGFDASKKIAHQFSAGGNGQGATYGCASTDLDLNIFLTDAYQRLFHPGPVPPAPSQGDDDMPVFISNKTAGKYGAAPSPQGGCTIWEMVRNAKSALSFEAWIGYGTPYGIALDDYVIDGIPDYVAGGSDEARLARLETVAIQLNDAVGRVGQTVGDIQAGLVKAGGG